MKTRSALVLLAAAALAFLGGCGGMGLTVTLKATGSSPAYWGWEVALLARASGGGGDSMTYKYYANDVLIPGASSYLSYWLPYDAGTYTLKVVATDGNGHTASDTTSMTIQEGAYWTITNGTTFPLYYLSVSPYGGHVTGPDLLGGVPLANNASITVHANAGYCDLLAKTQADDHEWAVSDTFSAMPGNTGTYTLDATDQVF